MKYFLPLQVKRLQKNIRGQSWRSKKNLQDQASPGASVSNLAESAIFFRPPTLTSDFFAASIWKIWFISVWRLKPKAVAWLLTWVMLAQNALISYHTDAFVKTEVCCTVLWLCQAPSLVNNRIRKRYQLEFFQGYARKNSLWKEVFLHISTCR